MHYMQLLPLAQGARSTTARSTATFNGRGRSAWPVQHAKARFSELLDAGQREGPQVVSRRGTEAAVWVPPRGSAAAGRAPMAPCSPGFRALTMPTSISPASPSAKSRPASNKRF